MISNGTAIGQAQIFDRARSLGQALANVPQELGLAEEVRFRVILEGKRRDLSAALHAELYRIVREAIVNACRHSHANQIDALIQYRRDGLRLVVCDDGRGIDAHYAWKNREHSGLWGMKEQAEKMGAKLRIWSRAARGTEVELNVPAQVAFA